MGSWQFELRKDLLGIRSSFYTIATKGDKMLGKADRPLFLIPDLSALT